MPNKQPVNANILSLSGLPDSVELKEEILSEMRALQEHIIDGPFAAHIEELFEYGRVIFEQRSPFGDQLREFDAAARREYMPPILLGDNKLWLPEDKDESSIWKNLDHRWQLTANVPDQIEEFIAVCGV